MCKAWHEFIEPWLLQVRAEVSEHNVVAVIVKAMKHWASSGGVQCNGCLAIVSLVRAESKVCQVRLRPHNMPSGAMLMLILILHGVPLRLQNLQLAIVADHRRRRTVVCNHSSTLCSSMPSKECKVVSSCTASWRCMSSRRLNCSKSSCRQEKMNVD